MRQALLHRLKSCCEKEKGREREWNFCTNFHTLAVDLAESQVFRFGKMCGLVKWWSKWNVINSRIALIHSIGFYFLFSPSLEFMCTLVARSCNYRKQGRQLINAPRAQERNVRVAPLYRVIIRFDCFPWEWLTQQQQTQPEKFSHSLQDE